MKFPWSSLRSGTSPGCLTSMTRSRLGRSEMQPLKSWPAKPKWRWQYGSRTRSTIWTSMYTNDYQSRTHRAISLLYQISSNSSCFQYFFLALFSLFFLCFSARIIELNGGQSPLTYKRFQTLISRMEAVETPAEAITGEVMGSCTTPLSDDHDEKFGVPSLEELGEFLVL